MAEAVQMMAEEGVHAYTYRRGGYTLDEARKAFAKQRRYESGIRRQKRVVEALKAGGMDTKAANARLNQLRHRLQKHIDENGKILRRERHREQLYDSARRVERLKEPGRRRGRPGPSATGTAVADAVWEASYTDRFAFVEDAAARAAIADEARRMLKRRGGTVYEDACAVSAATGAAVARTESGKEPHRVRLNMETRAAIDSAAKGTLAIMHNHPQSMPPSAEDFAMLAKKSLRYSLIVCHDGSVVRIRVTDWSLFAKVVDSGRIGEINDVFNGHARYYGTKDGDNALALILGREYGVTYERYD